MTFVMSDIHGEYEKYIAMLEKINFKDTDTLYILGDVVDRGDRPIDVLLDMLSRPNVFPIIGNHEIMAVDILKKLSVQITEDTFASHIDKDFMSILLEYQQDGGEPTIKQFQQQDPENREVILEYLEEEFVPYDFAKVNGKKFLLVHSGLGNFSIDKELDDYTLDELVNIRPDYDKKYFDDDNIYIVSGHTPTLSISGKAEIYKSNNNICIDCGATFDGRLSCLCLDTFEEFYVD